MEKQYMPSWFQSYFDELYSINDDIDIDFVINKIIKTRENAIQRNNTFDGSLPSINTIQNWKISRQNKCPLTNTLILYFFEVSIFGKPVTNTTCSALAQFKDASQIWLGSSHVLRILTEDVAMRGTLNFPHKRNTWTAQANRVRLKYPGFYILIRMNSSGALVTELFGIEEIQVPKNIRNADALSKKALQSQVQQSIQIRWNCENELWVGDLIIGNNKFSGVILKNRVFDLPDPINMTVLRNQEDITDLNIPEWEQCPILTGAVIGTSTKYKSELFKTPFLIIKFPNMNSVDCNEYNFNLIIKNKSFSNFLEEITSANDNQITVREKLRSKKMSVHSELGQEIFGNQNILEDFDVSDFITPLAGS